MRARLLVGQLVVLVATTLSCDKDDGIDRSDEVNYITYCEDRCQAICEVAVEAETYLYAGELPGGVTAEQLCQEDCETNLSCFLGQLCTSYENAYISINEADACLDEWRALDVEFFAANAPDCGRDTDGDGRADFQQCPEFSACSPDVLCDPPEWE